MKALQAALSFLLLGLGTAVTAAAQPGCRQITETTQGNNEFPGLGGDGIAFQSTSDLVGTNGDGNREIFFWDGTTFSQITNTLAAESFVLNWGVDGEAFAFSSNGDLIGMNGDGNQEIFFWDGVTISQITDSAVPGTISFTPSLDNGAIAFSSNANLVGTNGDENSEVFLWDGSSLSQITDTATGDGQWALVEGGTIAFTSTADLVGMNPDGGEEIFFWDGATISQITLSSGCGGIFGLLPSLDDGEIAFDSTCNYLGSNGDGNYEIYLWDGASLSQITDTTSGLSVTPSLDQGRIAFTSTADLVGMNGDGGAEVFFWDGTGFSQITSSSDPLSPIGLFPHLEGGAIAFRSTEDLFGTNPDGNSEIFLCSAPIVAVPSASPLGTLLLAACLAVLGMIVMRRQRPA